jgi:hypothetical protein
LTDKRNERDKSSLPRPWDLPSKGVDRRSLQITAGYFIHQLGETGFLFSHRDDLGTILRSLRPATCSQPTIKQAVAADIAKRPQNDAQTGGLVELVGDHPGIRLDRQCMEIHLLAVTDKGIRDDS